MGILWSLKKMCGTNDTIPVVINAWFFVDRISQIVLTPVAVIFNVSLIIALIKLKSIHLHINLRLLLGNVSACSTLASIYSFIKSVTTLVMWIVGGKCSLIESYLTCKLHDGIFLAAKLPVVFSLVVSGIERFYAIRHFQTYAVVDDGGQRLAKVPVAAICSVWISSIGLVIFLTLTSAYNNAYEIAYCTVLFVYDTTIVNATCASLLFMEMCTLSVYATMWVHTAKRMAVSVDRVTSESYQLNDRLARKTTLNVSRFMVYSVIVHAICWATILIFILFMVNYVWDSSVYLIIGDGLFYLLSIFHMIIHPVLSVYNCEIICLEMAKLYPSLRSLWKKLGDKEKQKTPSVVVTFRNHDQHFGNMNDLWKTKKDKKK